MRRIRKSVQSGFTLIELIVVIVIIGILAAVAIPNVTTSSNQAICGVQQATLGALKSAWSLAYAAQTTPGTLPSIASVAGQMSDPTCTAGTLKITCNVTATTGATTVDFTVGADPVPAPSSITHASCT